MILLTFDTDYLNAAQLARFANEFPIPGQATFFLWEPAPGLALGEHELQPHPFLKENEEPWAQTLDNFEKQWGRKGTFMRAHSCAYSQLFGVQLKNRGYVGISQATLLEHPRPFAYRHPWGMWELPIYYMEYADMCMRDNWPDLGHAPFSPALIEQAVKGDGLYVFSFHPIHLLLNSQSQNDYRNKRDKILSGELDLFNCAAEGYGSRNYYLDLVKAMQAHKHESVGCHRYVEWLEKNDRRPLLEHHA